MARRYAFWRDKTGKPHKGTGDQYAPKELLKCIGESSEPHEGGVSHKSGRHMHDMVAVRSLLAISGIDGAEMNEFDKRQIVNEAIREIILSSGGCKPISPSELIKVVDKRAAVFYRRAVKDFYLLTSLSIASFPAKTIRCGDCELFFPKNGRGKVFPFPEVYNRRRQKSGVHQNHEGGERYQVVRVKVSGRSSHEAVDKALDAVDLLRGLWTLISTLGQWSDPFPGHEIGKPKGVIHVGPVHTLHFLDGQLVEDRIYWFNDGFLTKGSLFVPKKGWEDVESERKWIGRKVSHLSYKDDLEQLIRRYANALDLKDLNTASLHLWGILERITDTVGSDYDKTIKRAAWVFHEKAYVKEQLKCIRLRRNRYVHAADSGDDEDEVVNMIKLLVDPHLVRLLRNDFEVSSLKEYGDQLDVPTNMPDIKAQQKRLRYAEKMAKEASKG